MVIVIEAWSEANPLRRSFPAFTPTSDLQGAPCFPQIQANDEACQEGIDSRARSERLCWDGVYVEAFVALSGYKRFCAACQTLVILTTTSIRQLKGLLEEYHDV